MFVAKQPTHHFATHCGGRPPLLAPIKPFLDTRSMGLEASDCKEAAVTFKVQSRLVEVVVQKGLMGQQRTSTTLRPRPRRVRQMESSDLHGLFAQSAKTEENKNVGLMEDTKKGTVMKTNVSTVEQAKKIRADKQVAATPLDQAARYHSWAQAA